MHFQQRGKRQYLYRSYRDSSGNVCREYIGTGAVADLCLAKYQGTKAQEAARHEQLQQLLDEVDHTQREAHEFALWVELMARGGLLRAGFYLHQRSQWRTRNGKAKTKENEAPDANQGGVPGVGQTSQR
jgi:hypothetical protein